MYERPEIVALVRVCRRLEFAGRNRFNQPVCPVCGRPAGAHHLKACELRGALEPFRELEAGRHDQ